MINSVEVIEGYSFSSKNKMYLNGLLRRTHTIKKTMPTEKNKVSGETKPLRINEYQCRRASQVNIS
jgi:hypothetical protein